MIKETLILQENIIYVTPVVEPLDKSGHQYDDKTNQLIIENEAYTGPGNF